MTKRGSRNGLVADYDGGSPWTSGGLFNDGPKLHRILGYTTMAGVVTTALLGWLAPGDLHEAAAIGTTGLAVATSGVGIATYARDRSIPLGHGVLTSLGTLGFVANLVEEPEESEHDDGRGGDSGTSQLHRWIGTGASAAFALGIV